MMTLSLSALSKGLVYVRTVPTRWRSYVITLCQWYLHVTSSKDPILRTKPANAMNYIWFRATRHRPTACALRVFWTTRSKLNDVHIFSRAAKTRSFMQPTESSFPLFWREMSLKSVRGGSLAESACNENMLNQYRFYLFESTTPASFFGIVLQWKKRNITWSCMRRVLVWHCFRVTGDAIGAKFSLARCVQRGVAR